MHRFIPVVNNSFIGYLRLSAFLLLSMSVGGCSLLSRSDKNSGTLSGTSVGNPQPADFATGRSELVASNLIAALIQIPEASPLTTTLSIFKPETSYGKVVTKELQRVGYDLRIATNSNAPNFLNYLISAPGSSEQRIYEFALVFGKIKVLRRYKLEGVNIVPDSELVVLGSSVTNIISDDSMFSEKNQSGSTNVLAKATLPAPGNDVIEKLNIYETRRSNFADQWVNYEDISQSIIVFPNDSVVLGEINKQLTAAILDDFDPQTDLISVIGCSHGKTALENGNQRLAIGRSQRVREELIIAGLSSEYIFDEGCWAPRHFDEMMPRRGVVLTLKRLLQTG